MGDRLIKLMASSCSEKIARINWSQISHQLSQSGFAITDRVFEGAQCNLIQSWYNDEALFRKTITMQRHQFGSGEYQYFRYPLPSIVQLLREALYEYLAPIANQWAACLKLKVSWPERFSEFMDDNAAAGQTKATPLMLDYGPGDYNCLHQDKYGECYFPFQALLLLSEPDRDFFGGEFVLVENRPRMQSRVCVVPIKQGQILIFPNQFGLRKSGRGYSKTLYRHGVSQIHSGYRKSLGIIFHDSM